LVSAQKISFQYPNGKPLQFPDFTLEKGGSCLILGQSGSGKTTLLHLLAGLLSPQSGTLTIADQNINAFSAAQRDAFRSQHIGLVFQKNHLVRSLTAIENVALAQLIARKKNTHLKPQQILEQLGLGHRLHAPAYTLSVGEQQRVAIARALVHQPTLLLADEPTSALDDLHAAEVAQLLINNCSQLGTTLIIVTHDNRIKTTFNNHLTL
jgi:putative ABC transport system ATP-binding protein